MAQRVSRKPWCSNPWCRLHNNNSACKQSSSMIRLLTQSVHASLQKARKQREDAKQQREANRLKSAVTSVVTNPKTLKKMMKSKTQRKKLIKGDPGPAT